MEKANGLDRFITAQQGSYERALREIQRGRKTSHWMWYIFPQISGLGFSDISTLYAIKNIPEATTYLQHPVLGARLIEISSALLQLRSNDATAIMGTPDDIKLRSSMTLFAAVENSHSVFQQVLDKFFNGQKDEQTLALLGRHPG